MVAQFSAMDRRLLIIQIVVIVITLSMENSHAQGVVGEYLRKIGNSAAQSNALMVVEQENAIWTPKLLSEWRFQFRGLKLNERCRSYWKKLSEKAEKKTLTMARFRQSASTDLPDNWGETFDAILTTPDQRLDQMVRRDLEDCVDYWLYPRHNQQRMMDYCRDIAQTTPPEVISNQPLNPEAVNNPEVVVVPVDGQDMQPGTTKVPQILDQNHIEVIDESSEASREQLEQKYQDQLKLEAELRSELESLHVKHSDWNRLTEKMEASYQQLQVAYQNELDKNKISNHYETLYNQQLLVNEELQRKLNVINGKQDEQLYLNKELSEKLNEINRNYDKLVESSKLITKHTHEIELEVRDNSRCLKTEVSTELKPIPVTDNKMENKQQVIPVDRNSPVVMKAVLSKLTREDKDKLFQELSNISPPKHYLSRKVLLKLYQMRLIMDEEQDLRIIYQPQWESLVNSMEMEYSKNIDQYMDANFNEPTNDNWIVLKSQNRYKSMCQLSILDNVCRIASQLINGNSGESNDERPQLTGFDLKRIYDMIASTTSEKVPGAHKLAALVGYESDDVGILLDDCNEINNFMVPINRLDIYKSWLSRESTMPDALIKDEKLMFYHELRNLCRLITSN